MFTFVCVNMCVCVYVHVQLCVQVGLCTCIQVCAYVSVSVEVCTCTGMCNECMPTCAYRCGEHPAVGGAPEGKEREQVPLTVFIGAVTLDYFPYLLENCNFI